MKKSCVFALCFLLFLTGTASAWSDVYSWTPSPGATGYKVETTADNGVTWTLAGQPTTPTFTLVSTVPGLLLVRVTACSGNGCNTRAWSGFWHNETWNVPTTVTNMTITP